MMTPIEHYAQFFSTLKSDFRDEVFNDTFSPVALFEDPFQRVRGTEAIITVFRHMYETLYNPRFIIKESLGNEQSGYIRWKFVYARSSTHTDESFEGVSHVVFDENSFVVSHIDYWDAASNVYEKIPFLGFVLRLMKNKIKAS